MKLASEGKINNNGIISSDDLITEKEGYEAMLYMLMAYWEATGSKDLTDILSGGEYWAVPGKPADTAFWEYWLEAIIKVKTQGPPPLKDFVKVEETSTLSYKIKLSAIILFSMIVVFLIYRFFING